MEFKGVIVVPPEVPVVRGRGPIAGDCDRLRSGDGGGLGVRMVVKVIGPVVHCRRNGGQL